jgi:hypothetical protein
MTSADTLWRHGRRERPTRVIHSMDIADYRPTFKVELRKHARIRLQ